MKAALLFAVCVAGSPALAADLVARPPTVSGYLALCDADAKSCADRLFDDIWEHSVGDQKLGFCLPDHDTMEQITGVVTAWLKARPELADKPTDPTLLKAMEANYRCG